MYSLQGKRKMLMAGAVANKMGAFFFLINRTEIVLYQYWLTNANISVQMGNGSFKYAWVLDKLKAERKRGIPR